MSHCMFIWYGDISQIYPQFLYKNYVIYISNDLSIPDLYNWKSCAEIHKNM
jgi:hypothetical protein